MRRRPKQDMLRCRPKQDVFWLGKSWEACGPAPAMCRDPPITPNRFKQHRHEQALLTADVNSTGQLGICHDCYNKPDKKPDVKPENTCAVSFLSTVAR